MMSPVFYVIAKDKIQLNEYERSINGVFTCKYVTNNLTVGRQLNYGEVMYWALEQSVFSFPHSLLDKPEMSTHEVTDHSVKPLVQTLARKVTIDTTFIGKHYTIFSNTINLLTVTNKTKLVQYVNRYVGCEQYITPVPRYSTVEFKQCDKIGKIVS